MKRTHCLLLSIFISCRSEAPSRASGPTEIPEDAPAHPGHARVDLIAGWRLALSVDDSGQLERFQLIRGSREEGPFASWTNGKLTTIGTTSELEIEGVLHNFYESGAVMAEKRFVKGKQQGTSKYWFESGALRRSGQYVDDWPVGEWIEWFPSGEVRAIERYYPPSDRFDPKFRPLFRTRRCTPGERMVEEIRNGERVRGVIECPAEK